MKIVLIGNYQLDRQESMIRFTQMLKAGFSSAGIETEIWWPNIFFGSWLSFTGNGISKWIGYLDKWIVFPVVLKWRLFRYKNNSTIFHVCDHSNAPYLKYLPENNASITCHDVIAIRGALGYADAYANASTMGKILQKWILYHLDRAKILAAVSQFTLLQLKSLLQEKERKNWRVVYNAFNADFLHLNSSETAIILQDTALDLSLSFILHVGSGHARKNRKMLLDMMYVLGNRWGGQVCFAGESVDEELLNQANMLGLTSRLVSIEKPNHTVLVALYSACEAFIFPSFSEGFGWPVIEAQACGAPVIASSYNPMPEICGGAAIHADPNSAEDFAEALLALRNPVIRDGQIERGYENCTRFTLKHMVNSYLDLFQASIKE